MCFFKFCLGRDVWEQQLHRVLGGTAAAFHQGMTTDNSTRAASELNGRTDSRCCQRGLAGEWTAAALPEVQLAWDQLQKGRE